jgi:hypothetical protein
MPDNHNETGATSQSDIVRLGDGSIEIRCRSCHERFYVTPAEQNWYQELARIQPDRAVFLPKHCEGCRTLRRKSRDQVTRENADRWLTCATCGVSFQLRDRDREYYTEQSHQFPRSCYDCRRGSR